MYLKNSPFFPWNDKLCLEKITAHEFEKENSPLFSNFLKRGKKYPTINNKWEGVVRTTYLLPTTYIRSPPFSSIIRSDGRLFPTVANRVLEHFQSYIEAVPTAVGKSRAGSWNTWNQLCRTVHSTDCLHVVHAVIVSPCLQMAAVGPDSHTAVAMVANYG
jgi:hypothetical protein